ncbi:disintegrin and metalloproteinase domain-containing protein 10 homolog isoform X2 [Leptinotarsa decemlineata]|uniref:disintegrin and metalloproteinase domain-containing protein 10 homolog isoform X2 n=1 Tax=Leptinotarsa decemlineata TaxID=7539 RepID=UPI003D3043D0
MVLEVRDTLKKSQNLIAPTLNRSLLVSKIYGLPKIYKSGKSVRPFASAAPASEFESLNTENFKLISSRISGYQNAAEINKDIINSAECLIVQLEIDDKKSICLKSKHSDVFNFKTQLRIYTDSNGRYQNIEQEKNLVEGYITSEPNSSYVGGYIESIYFYGKVRSFDKIFHVDNLKSYPLLQRVNNDSNKNAVVFESKTNSEMNGTSKKAFEFFNSRGNISPVKRNSEDNIYQLFKTMIQKGKVCTLLVVIDNSFLHRIYNDNMDSAVKYVLFSIDEANSLFRSTDFDDDGYPDNIGLLIKYLVIIQSEKSPMNLLPKYSKKAMDVKYYLKMFSRYNLLSEVCLGVAFTGQTFKNDIIGVSYSAVPVNRKYFQLSIGGICDRPLMNQLSVNLNTLVVSAASENGTPIPQYMFHLSLTHELGHSFGSDHDKTNECEGHLMTDHTPKNLERKHFVFSPCSKRMILETIVTKGHCLQDYDESYCGLIEPGEECDCGTTKDCEEFDACCSSRGTMSPCQLRRDKGYQCHPSQGLCCSSKCMYKDLSEYDLNCKNFQNSCPCRNSLKICSCGIQGRCLQSSCTSEECARLNLNECVCPEYLEKHSCQTCCSLNGSCLHSRIVTKQLIEQNDSLIEDLEMISNRRKSGRFSIHEKLCNEKTCVNISFRTALANDYCLLYGQLGICNEHYECIIPDSKLIYPSVPVEKIKKSGMTSNSIFKFELLGIVIFCSLICYFECIL